MHIRRETSWCARWLSEEFPISPKTGKPAEINVLKRSLKAATAFFTRSTHTANGYGWCEIVFYAPCLFSLASDWWQAAFSTKTRYIRKCIVAVFMCAIPWGERGRQYNGLIYFAVIQSIEWHDQMFEFELFFVTRKKQHSDLFFSISLYFLPILVSFGRIFWSNKKTNKECPGACLHSGKIPINYSHKHDLCLPIKTGFASSGKYCF